MRKTIAISVLLDQVQVAISENGRLVEYYLERDVEECLVGNIYKGRVENILPGMEAAFVDIGAGKNAFLYVADLPRHPADQGIGDLLKKGESILVQVSKEATGSKGPRVTTEIGLPGRYLVLLPDQDHAGISRRISDEEERARLKELANEIRPGGQGLIVRTVAEGCGRKKLQEDLEDLLEKWNDIKKKSKRYPKASLVYRDHDLIYRILRDFLTSEVSKIVIEGQKLCDRVRAELADLGFKSKLEVECYEGKISLFDHLGLGKELERARSKKVWLNCGGYLVFDQTEALLSIDVNTGKYVGGHDLRETVLKTNLQAAEEIARQLRLRNIGGIVIIDFIDMPEEDRKAVLERMTRALGEDKTLTNLYGFTRLGLLELTRKKSEKLLADILDIPCPCCQGSGRVAADETIAGQIASEVYYLAREEEGQAILVKCHAAIEEQLRGPKGENLIKLRKAVGKPVYTRREPSFARHEYDLVLGREKRLRRQASPGARRD